MTAEAVTTKLAYLWGFVSDTTNGGAELAEQWIRDESKLRAQQAFADTLGTTAASSSADSTPFLASDADAANPSSISSFEPGSNGSDCSTSGFDDSVLSAHVRSPCGGNSFGDGSSNSQTRITRPFSATPPPTLELHGLQGKVFCISISVLRHPAVAR